MNNQDRQIIKFIKKGGKRIRLNIFLDNFLMSLGVALGITDIVSILGLFIPIYNLLEVNIGIVCISMFIYIFIYFYKLRPNIKKVALILDSKGINERLTTSVELINKEDNLSIAQKEDTIAAIKEIKISKINKFHIKRKNLYRLIATLTVFIIIICIPTEAKNRASEIRKIKKFNKEVIEKIKDEKKETKSSKELLEENKVDIIKELDKALDEIKRSKSKVDTEKDLNKLEKKLENIENNLNNDDSKKKIQNIMEKLNFNGDKSNENLKMLNKIASGLSEIDKTKELSEAINSQDDGKIKDALNNLEEDLKNLKDEDVKEISSDLNKISSNISDENTKEALSSIASSLNSGDIDLSKLENALLTLNKNSNSTNNGNENKGTRTQNNKSGNENGSGNGNGSGKGSGQGMGNGKDSGQGSGWSTGDKENGGGELNSGEKVFLPSRNLGNDENLKGSIGEGGNSQSITTKNGMNISGDSVDYEKIIHEYSNSEIAGLENKSIPESLQELIKKYFEELK